jgi:hypothetical protein
MPRDRRVEKIRRWLRRFRMETNLKHALHAALPELIEKPNRLAAFPLTDAQMGALRSILED